MVVRKRVDERGATGRRRWSGVERGAGANEGYLERGMGVREKAGGEGAAGKAVMERSRERLERMKGLRKVRNGRPEVERETDAKRAETTGSRMRNGCEASRNRRKVRSGQLGSGLKTEMERNREGLERMKGLRKVRNGRPEVERETDEMRAETAGKYVVDCWETAGSRTGNGCEASRNRRELSRKRMKRGV